MRNWSEHLSCDESRGSVLSIDNCREEFGFTHSLLVNQIQFKQNSTVRLTTTKQYDYLNRLISISSVPSASSAVSFGYAYADILGIANPTASVTVNSVTASRKGEYFHLA